MEEIKLCDDVIEQIKDFVNWNLTAEQKLLIDKLILDESLKERYIKRGLCKKCKQPYTGIGYSGDYWCQTCSAMRFQQNFENWTSGNDVIDKFIQNAQLKAKFCEDVLEWIEYDRFEDVEYLAEGGFGTTYKATWKDGFIIGWDPESNQWKRTDAKIVALKCLHNSKDITVEFLREIESHHKMNYSCKVVSCKGITKDPKTNNFIMVMQFIEFGSLRQYLNQNFNRLGWMDKLETLEMIIAGLNDIHNEGLIHRDFHCGNILSNHKSSVSITDLGLCQPANVKCDNKQIYGVLPYVAPEVLRGKEYTQESDIYGFGIIAYEVWTGLPPYHDIAHDEFLTIRICQGLRPESNYKIPQLILDIIKQCWDVNPSKRPKAKELPDRFYGLKIEARDDKNSLISKQIKEADKINEQLPSIAASLSYITHSQAVYTSRLLDFKNLPKSKNANNNDDNDNLFETEYSESIKVDFTKLNINFKDKNN